MSNLVVPPVPSSLDKPEEITGVNRAAQNTYVPYLNFDASNNDYIDTGRQEGDEDFTMTFCFRADPDVTHPTTVRVAGNVLNPYAGPSKGWLLYVLSDINSGGVLQIAYSDGTTAASGANSTVNIIKGDLCIAKISLNTSDKQWKIQVWNLTQGTSESEQTSSAYGGTASFDSGSNVLALSVYSSPTDMAGVMPYLYCIGADLTANEGEAIKLKMESGGQVSFPSDVYPFFDPDNDDYIDSGQTGFGAYDDTWYGRVKLDAENWVVGGGNINLLFGNEDVIGANQGVNLTCNAAGQLTITVNDGTTGNEGQATSTGFYEIGDDLAWVVYADHSTKSISAKIKNITKQTTSLLVKSGYTGTHDFDNETNIGFMLFGGGTNRDTACTQTHFGRIHKLVTEAQADTIINQMENGLEVTFGGYNFISNSDDLGDFYAVSSGTFPTITTGQEDSDGGSNAIKVDHLADGQTDLSRIMMQFSPNAPTGDGFLLPNQTYTFSVWAKGEVGGEALTIYRYDASPDNSSEAVVLTTEWVRYDFTFTFADFDPASEIANIQLRSGSNSAQTMYFHKAMINQGTTALDYESGGATVFPFGLNRRALDTEVTGLLNGSGNNLTTVGIDFEGNDIRITATIKTANSQGILFNEEDGTGPFFLCWENGNTGSSTGSQTSLTIDGIDHTSSNRDELHTALTDGAFHDIELVFNGDLIQQGSKQILLNEFPSFRAIIYYANQIGIDIGNTGELDHTYLPSGVATTEGTIDMSLTGNVVDGVRYYADDTDGGKIIYQNTGTIELQTIADNILRDMPDLNRRAVDDEVVYQSDFTSGVDGWSDWKGSSDGNIDGIDGRDNNLRLTLEDGNGSHYLNKTVLGGGFIRVEAEINCPDSQIATDGIQLSQGLTEVTSFEGINGDGWVPIREEFNLTETNIRFFAMDGGSTTVNGDGDVIYVRNVKVTRLGYADTGDGAGALTVQASGTSEFSDIPKINFDRISRFDWPFFDASNDDYVDLGITRGDADFTEFFMFRADPDASVPANPRVAGNVLNSFNNHGWSLYFPDIQGDLETDDAVLYINYYDDIATGTDGVYSTVEFGRGHLGIAKISLDASAKQWKIQAWNLSTGASEDEQVSSVYAGNAAFDNGNNVYAMTANGNTANDLSGILPAFADYLTVLSESEGTTVKEQMEAGGEVTYEKNAYTSDFSAGTDEMTGLVNGTISGNIDGIGGRDDNYRFTLSGGSGQHYGVWPNAQDGAIYDLTFDIFIPSSNSVVSGVNIRSVTNPIQSVDPVADTWETHTVRVPSQGANIRWYATNGVSATIDADGDVFYLRNIQINVLPSLNRRAVCDYRTLLGGGNYYTMPQDWLDAISDMDDLTVEIHLTGVTDGDLVFMGNSTNNDDYIGLGDDGNGSDYRYAVNDVTAFPSNEFSIDSTAYVDEELSNDDVATLLHDGEDHIIKLDGIDITGWDSANYYINNYFNSNYNTRCGYKKVIFRDNNASQRFYFEYDGFGKSAVKGQSDLTFTGSEQIGYYDEGDGAGDLTMQMTTTVNLPVSPQYLKDV